MEFSNEELDALGQKITAALNRLKEVSQGRVYNVGTKVMYKGKLGIVTDLNKDAKDPKGSTVDIRLEDGKVINKVSVDSSSLSFLRQ